MSVMFSPFNISLPSFFLLLSFWLTSAASSRTKFMYSSNPMITPSILMSVFSKSMICTRDLFWRYLKISAMGWIITRRTRSAISTTLYRRGRGTTARAAEET
eukprot:TRINITY_DN18948_c0_g1_i1.p2 TRINITY_DN18948_c0_g1~~TRINITY_DN18948_c0_g1_i1.p2  ORF type:complete len:102 (+),score=1.10 TRINITY_DN18948_c0_g1_i1:165-470(+)